MINNLPMQQTQSVSHLRPSSSWQEPEVLAESLLTKDFWQKQLAETLLRGQIKRASSPGLYPQIVEVMNAPRSSELTWHKSMQALKACLIK